MAGPLCLERVMEAVEKSPVMVKIVNELASLRRQNNSLAESAAATGHTTTPRMYNVMAWLQREYEHPDKIYCWVPPSWKFPPLNLQPMYAYWHCGDESEIILPTKYLDKREVLFLGKCAHVSLSELRKVMLCIDEAAKTNGCPPKEHMSHKDANSCYLRGECGILSLMPDKMPIVGGELSLIRSGLPVKNYYE